MLAENLPEFRDSPSRLNKLLDLAHPPIGKMIMDTWAFPAELKQVPSEYINFQRNHDSKADYVDIVQVAFLQGIAGTDHPACRLNWDSIPAFQKLGLATDVEILEIAGVAEDIDMTTTLLT